MFSFESNVKVTCSSLPFLSVGVQRASGSKTTIRSKREKGRTPARSKKSDAPRHIFTCRRAPSLPLKAFPGPAPPPTWTRATRRRRTRTSQELLVRQPRCENLHARTHIRAHTHPLFSPPFLAHFLTVGVCECVCVLIDTWLPFISGMPCKTRIRKTLIAVTAWMLNANGITMLFHAMTILYVIFNDGPIHQMSISRVISWPW